MLLRIGKACLLLFLLGPLSLRAEEHDVRISASATPNAVSEHESVQLQVMVESPLSMPVSQPTIDAPDFTVMGAPGLNFVPLNGPAGMNTRKKLTFTFVLMPKRPGGFIVRNIRAKADQRLLSAPDVSIRVSEDSNPRPPLPVPPGDQDESTNPASPSYSGQQFSRPSDHASSQRQQGISIPDRFNSDFTVHAHLNKTKAYVGEPIVVEYYLYDYGGIRQSEVLKWPTFDGFWKEDLELTTQVSFADVYLRNQEMRRAFIARYALYGIKPGRFSIDKLGIRGKYVSGDMLNPGILFGFDMRTGQHYSQDLTVEIIPLPETGKPEKFGGAVGKFSLKLEADKLSLSQNTPVTFTLTLSGTGNFQAINAIRLPLPQDFELYESTSSGRAIAPIGIRQELESKKTFQVIAIPRKAGKFEIPAVTWSYFNTDKGGYDSLTTSPLTIEVQPNEAGNAGANSYLSPAPGSSETPAANQVLAGLKPLSLDKSADRGFVRWALWTALAVNALLAFRFLRTRSRNLYKLVKGMDRFSGARVALLQAKGAADGEWQAGLEEVLIMIMQVLLDTNPRGLTKHELEESWKARGLPAPLFLRASALLEEIDRHRFSSQKLAGSVTKDVRSRLIREAESLLAEASQAKRK
jgi:hypothetical protein